MMAEAVPHAESVRYHLDWWGQCRTCRFWGGPRAKAAESGPCLNRASDLFEKPTTTSGECAQWDSFDLNAAIEVMDL
jgi:hypothetical protein